MGILCSSRRYPYLPYGEGLELSKGGEGNFCLEFQGSIRGLRIGYEIISNKMKWLEQVNEMKSVKMTKSERVQEKQQHRSITAWQLATTGAY